MTWSALAEVVEGDLALARDGRWDELSASLADRPALLRGIPDATAADLPLLERVATAHGHVANELALAREGAARELGAVRRGRGAMTGYAAVSGPARRRFDAAG
jgi:hypothetical protein